MMRRVLLSLAVPAALLAAVTVSLPSRSDALRFAVIGDTGTGSQRQYDVAQRMVEAREQFPFSFVIMLGDNMYGGERANDFEKKFHRPYRTLLDGGVTFHAVLGNHDNSSQVNYGPFNMGGQRYYTFSPRPDVEFFALDSNYMDPAQIRWLETSLEKSKARWKICFMHHPLYSSGEKHGSDVALRQVIEPLFVKFGVSLVLAGHEHFYERIKPQKEIAYFISGAGGQLREGNIRSRSELEAKGFDDDLSFMLMQISGDKLDFECIARDGSTVDKGEITARK